MTCFLHRNDYKLNVQTASSLRNLGSVSSQPHNRRHHAAVPVRDLYIRHFHLRECPGLSTRPADVAVQ